MAADQRDKRQVCPSGDRTPVSSDAHSCWVSKDFILLQAQGSVDKERGAGDWQHYQTPKEVLSQVAARNRQLPGPPGPPPQKPAQASLLLPRS